MSDQRSSKQVPPETLAAYRNDIVPLGHFCGVGGQALLALLDYIDSLKHQVLELQKARTAVEPTPALDGTTARPWNVRTHGEDAWIEGNEIAGHSVAGPYKRQVLGDEQYPAKLNDARLIVAAVNAYRPAEPPSDPREERLREAFLKCRQMLATHTGTFYNAAHFGLSQEDIGMERASSTKEESR